LYSWALKIFKFPFVQRNWAEDQNSLVRVIDQYHQRPWGTWLAMFPEGTSLYAKTLERSQEFSIKHSRTPLNYVLEPRLKGFELCVNKFKPDYVLDVTMAYPELMEGIRPSPMRLLNGLFPKSVHFYARRFAMDEIMSAESAGSW